jgi:hypothetical protein
VINRELTLRQGFAENLDKTVIAHLPDEIHHQKEEKCKPTHDWYYYLHVTLASGHFKSGW